MHSSIATGPADPVRAQVNAAVWGVYSKAGSRSIRELLVFVRGVGAPLPASLRFRHFSLVWACFLFRPPAVLKSTVPRCARPAVDCGIPIHRPYLRCGKPRNGGTGQLNRNVRSPALPPITPPTATRPANKSPVPEKRRKALLPAPAPTPSPPPPRPGTIPRPGRNRPTRQPKTAVCRGRVKRWRALCRHRAVGARLMRA